MSRIQLQIEGDVMKRALLVAIGVFLAIGSVFFTLDVAGGEAQARGADKILEFDTMVGVSGPFAGTSILRGIR